MKLLPSALVGFALCVSQFATADTLLEIYEKALENDSQLKADRAAYEAGKEAIKIARSAFLPQINATFSKSKTDQDLSLSGLEPVANQLLPVNQEREEDEDGDQFSATLDQALINMPAVYRYKQGGINVESAEVQFKVDQQALVLRVAQAYFDVLRAVDNFQTSIAEERAIRSQLEQVQQRYEVGLTAITDVLEVQAAFDNATANTLQARGNLGIAYEALEVLTGEQEETISGVVEGFPVSNPVPANRDDWVQFALKNNNNLELARLQSELSGYRAKEAKSQHLPTLGAQVTVSNTESDTDRTTQNGANPPVDTTSSREIDRTGISLTLRVPIYSGGSTSAQRRQAYQQYIQAQELYTKAQRDTVQNTRSLYLTVETSVAQLKARQQSIISSRSALEATQAGYEVGTRNLVDVLLAQQTLFQAQRNYSNTLYDYIINTLRLKEAAGNLSVQDVVELNNWIDANSNIVRSEVETQTSEIDRSQNQ